MEPSLSFFLGFIFATRLHFAAETPTVEAALKAAGLDDGAI